MGRGWNKKAPQRRLQCSGISALVFLVGTLVAGGASAELPTVAPLIQQLHPDAAGLGFIEVINPSAEPLPLGDLYIATTPAYWRLVEGEVQELGADELLLRFPAEAVIPAGGRFIVQIGDDPEAFEDAWGVLPDAIVATADALQAPAMRAPLAAPPANPALAAEGGLLVLFGWDGESDRVLDADIVTWGTGARVDKSAAAADGPDADAEATPYDADTLAAEQRPAAAPAVGQALARAAGEQSERPSANGLDGVDETSEDMAAAFTAGAPVLVVSTPAESIRVEGQLLSGARAPEVAGLVLRFTGVESDREVTAGADGGFALELPSNATFIVTLEGPGILPTAFMLDTGEIDVDDLQWTVDGVWHIAGTVEAGVGSPVLEGLSVVIEETGSSLVLGADGAFDLTLDVGGDYTLLVDGAGVVAGRTQLTLEEDSVLDLRVVVDAGWDLAGSVRDATTGELLPEVTVTVAGRSTTTGADGAFALPDAPPGLASILFAAEGYEPVTLDVELRSDVEVEVELQSVLTWSLTLQVSTSDGGSAEGAEVQVKARADGALQSAPVESGAALFPALRADNYEVQVTLAGYRPLLIRAVPLAGDAAVSVLLVPESRQARATVEGCAVAGAPVGAFSPTSGLLAAILLGAAGGLAARRR